MKSGAAAGWAMLIVGALGQAGLEVIASGPILPRATALCLVVVLVGINAAETNSSRAFWFLGVALLCLLGVPLWVMHGASVIQIYDPASMPVSIFSPALLVLGTVLLQLARRHDPAKGS